MENCKFIDFAYETTELYEFLESCKKSQVMPCTGKEIVTIKKLLDLKLPIVSILSFNLIPGFIGAVHKDTNLENDAWSVDFALNIPIKYCDETYMSWFSSKITGELCLGPRGTNIPYLNNDDAVLLESFFCTAPFIAKTNDWHSISNSSAVHQSRLLSVRFEKTVTYSMLLDSFNT